VLGRFEEAVAHLSSSDGVDAQEEGMNLFAHMFVHLAVEDVHEARACAAKVRDDPRSLVHGEPSVAELAIACFVAAGDTDSAHRVLDTLASAPRMLGSSFYPDRGRARIHLAEGAVSAARENLQRLADEMEAAGCIAEELPTRLLLARSCWAADAAAAAAAELATVIAIARRTNGRLWEGKALALAEEVGLSPEPAAALSVVSGSAREEWLLDPASPEGSA
jgi:hypothetical protein